MYLVETAQEFVRYYRQNGGCSNCGGLPHTDSCFVGRFEQALSGYAHARLQELQKAPLQPDLAAGMLLQLKGLCEEEHAKVDALRTTLKEIHTEANRVYVNRGWHDRYAFELASKICDLAAAALHPARKGGDGT